MRYRACIHKMLVISLVTGIVDAYKVKQILMHNSQAFYHTSPGHLAPPEMKPPHNKVMRRFSIYCSLQDQIHEGSEVEN
jgi:hypothetical protein